MYIKNFESIDDSLVVKVDEATKDKLVLLGYCVLSSDKDYWIFSKSNELLKDLKLLKEGK